MSKQQNNPPQTSLFLRVLGGIYLVYLAWDMRSAIPDGPLYIIPIVIFAVVGFVLAAHSIWLLATHGYFRKTPEPETAETTEDREDESNE